MSEKQNTDLSAPGSPFEIEPATWRDLNALRELERVCFPLDHWPLLDLIAVLTLPTVVRLKAVVEGEMVGFIAGDRRPPKGVAWIATLGVMPEYRRLGIGRALLKACEASLNEPNIRLTVRKGNRPALRLYENAGYHRLGTWPRYYQDNRDAIVLEKKVGGDG